VIIIHILKKMGRRSRYIFETLGTSLLQVINKKLAKAFKYATYTLFQLFTRIVVYLFVFS